MRIREWVRVIAFTAAIGWLVFMAALWLHAFATCNGHVVKGWWDNPVCVGKP